MTIEKKNDVTKDKYDKREKLESNKKKNNFAIAKDNDEKSFDFDNNVSNDDNNETFKNSTK